MSIKRAHLDELQRIRLRVNSLFEEALLGAGLPVREERSPGTWAPAVDVLETGDGYVLVAELPGVRREDIEVAVKDRRLEISGQRQPLEEGQGFVRMERNYGPFRRSFEMEHALDPASVEAAFDRGVLTVRAAKQRQPASKARTIPIRDSSTGG
ncbi:MAG: Hsp20/alpha crystallin family protein [Acidobacteriota bacterium]